MSTVQEILGAMDQLTREELRLVNDAIAYADAHPDEAKSTDEVRALIPQWISKSKSQVRVVGTMPRF